LYTSDDNTGTATVLQCCIKQKLAAEYMASAAEITVLFAAPGAG